MRAARAAMDGGHEFSPGRDRSGRDHGRTLDGISNSNNSSISYTGFELSDVPPVSVFLSSTTSGYLNRRCRKQGMPLLTFGFASNTSVTSAKRPFGLQRPQQRAKKLTQTTRYFSLWLILSMAATICTFTSFVSERSQILSRQWRMEQAHPLSAQHMQQGRRRNLRTQTSPCTTVPSSSLLESSTLAKSTHRRGPKLRYLAFGSSVTWGFDLNNSSQNPYPYLLDSDVYSVALPWSLQYADLAAACTQSLLDGPSTLERNRRSKPFYFPDVITVEYTSVDVSESHLVLIQRLRRRYPTSIIVLVHMLDPMTHLFLQETLVEEGTADVKRMSFRDWKHAYDRKQGTITNSVSNGSPPNIIQSDDSTWELARSMMRATLKRANADPQDVSSRLSWTFVQPTSMDQPRLSSLVASDPLLLHYRHVSNFTIAATSNDLTAATQQMRSYLSQFVMDSTRSHEMERSSMTLLSSHGHEELARGIRSLVEDFLWQKNHFRWLFNLWMRYRHVSPKLGDWGSGDDCHLWYTTGDYDVEAVGGTPANLPLVPKSDWELSWMIAMLNLVIAAPHKHVLEFSRSHPISFDGSSSTITSYDSSNNYIVVHNPFPTRRLLSLTYLTDADGISYPKTRIIINDIATILLQPIHVTGDGDDSSAIIDEQSIGIARTSGVGYVPPGKSIVRLVPLQSTTLPFRLVGASILAEEVQDILSIEFALETDNLAIAS